MNDETMMALRLVPEDKRGSVTAYVFANEKEVNTAQILAFLLGGFGAHRFYLKQTGLGFLYLIFVWTFIPAFVAFVEIFLMTGYVKKYERELVARACLMHGCPGEYFPKEEKKKTPTWQWGLLVSAAGAMTLCGVAAIDSSAKKSRASLADATAAIDSAAKKSRASPADAPPPTKPEALYVGIQSLLSTYKQNELAGDNAWKGKLVTTTGKVNSVKNDIFGNPYVTVGTGAQFEIPVVQCTLHKSEAGKAATLSKGQRIQVTGEVTGLMMNVQMTECRISDD